MADSSLPVRARATDSYRVCVQTWAKRGIADGREPRQKSVASLPTWPYTCSDAASPAVYSDGANGVAIGVDDRDIVDELELLRLSSTPPFA